MYKVLIVDDEPFILDGLRHVIRWEEHGLEIAGVAQNGFQALDILDHTPIHMMITDIYMSRMDGLELIREAKKRRPSVKIVILSGYEKFALVKEAAKLGIENYLLKPVEEEELSQTLLNCVEKIESEIDADIQRRELYHNIRDNILNRWVTDSIGPEELKNRAEFLSLDLSFRYYQVCIAQSLHRSGSQRDRALLSYAVMNVCQETIAGRGSCNGLAFLAINGDTIILLAWNEEAWERESAGLLRECIGNVNRHLKIDLFLSAGSVEQGFLSVPASYRNADKLRNGHLDMPVNTVIEYAGIHRISDKSALAVEIMDRVHGSPRPLHPTLSAVLDYVNCRYAEEMSLKTLAVKFDINAAYLGQLFRQATGQIFSVYLNRKRIEAAKRLLTDTPLKTSEVAAKTGFSSVHYFTNVFKKVTGSYPAEYKKNRSVQTPR